MKSCMDHGVCAPADYFAVKVYSPMLWRGDLVFRTLTNGGGTCSASETADDKMDWFGCFPGTALGLTPHCCVLSQSTSNGSLKFLIDKCLVIILSV